MYLLVCVIVSAFIPMVTIFIGLLLGYRFFLFQNNSARFQKDSMYCMYCMLIELKASNLLLTCIPLETRNDWLLLAALPYDLKGRTVGRLC